MQFQLKPPQRFNNNYLWSTRGKKQLSEYEQIRFVGVLLKQISVLCTRNIQIFSLDLLYTT